MFAQRPRHFAGQAQRYMCGTRQVSAQRPGPASTLWAARSTTRASHARCQESACRNPAGRVQRYPCAHSRCPHTVHLLPACHSQHAAYSTRRHTPGVCSGVWRLAPGAWRVAPCAAGCTRQVSAHRPRASGGLRSALFVRHTLGVRTAPARLCPAELSGVSATRAAHARRHSLLFDKEGTAFF